MSAQQPTEAPRFRPVQLPSGQWRVLDARTGEHHGQAVRYQHEAQSRARRLELMYGTEAR